MNHALNISNALVEIEQHLENFRQTQENWQAAGKPEFYLTDSQLAILQSHYKDLFKSVQFLGDILFKPS